MRAGVDASPTDQPQRWHRSERRARGEVVRDDLATRGTPHTLVAQDVRERRVERADAVWHADNERVQTDRHDPSRLCALAVKGVELAADHQVELVRRPASADDLGQIVDLGRVWNRTQTLAANVHDVWLVIVDPVGDVAGTSLHKIVE